MTGGRRRAHVLLVVAALAGAACGSTTSDEPEPTTSPSTSPAPSTTGAPAPTTAPTTVATTAAPDIPTTAATTPPGDPAPDGTSDEVRLPLGTEVAIDDRTTLELVSIDEDSRCPPDVQCASAGDLRVTVRWRDEGGGEPVALELTWAYHAEPTPTPDGRHLLSLEDTDSSADPPVAIISLD